MYVMDIILDNNYSSGRLMERFLMFEEDFIA